ncbi:DUF4091 domain-containing protein [bacterium]|nr:DUF4091 domain-containing protein [bacterium]
MRHLLSIFLVISSICLAGDDWHLNLYLGRGDYWRQRIRVEIRNDADVEQNGAPLSIRIGKGNNEANLIGARAEEVRVCDERGREMLYNITSPNGLDLTKGSIPEGSTITIPIECPPKSIATYYIYFDNPSAWRVPDYLSFSTGVRNGGVEEGEGNEPTGWRNDPQDETHHLYWVSENPHSGKKCLKTVVNEGAQPTWIGTRQFNIFIYAGGRYILRGWVKAENVKGYAGLYIHAGNQQDPMVLNQVVSAGEGSYDWKEIKFEFVAPKEANIAEVGTVLWGTGTAWYDDISLECVDIPQLKIISVSKPEKLGLREIIPRAKWYDDNPKDDINWDYRVPLKVFNFSTQNRKALIAVNISQLSSQLRGKLNPASLRILEGERIIPFYRLNDIILFESESPARSLKVFHLYFSTDKRVKKGRELSYVHLLESEHNLVKNPSFEQGDNLPADWEGGAEGTQPSGTIMKLDSPGLFGKHCAKLFIPHGAQLAWTGWRQNVPVQPGKSYLYSAWLKCEDIRDGQVLIHAHYRNTKGELCKSLQYASAGEPISGTRNWTQMTGIFKMPDDVAFFQLHLTMLASGTVWHDGVLLAEVEEATIGELEAREELKELTVWQVPAVIKVFKEDLPPRKSTPIRIAMAKNEREPLQLAIRSPKAIKGIKVQVFPPVNKKGGKLNDFEIRVVGYVPIDHPSGYYSSTSPPWHRKYPTYIPATDGWAGWWPDPLLPYDEFDIQANKTQPIWIIFRTSMNVASGDYFGKVRLLSNGKLLKEIPFTVHIWDFALPDEIHTGAIYTCGIGSPWILPGKTQEETRQLFWQFMAERRLCPGQIFPEPIIKYENGKVITDFSEFDKSAEIYFNKLKMPYAFTPSAFYLFGWGFPPAEKWGEKPYPGDYPYKEANRSKLRDEYKSAYQACLRAFWEHLKEKGWDKKFVLYIADEPFDYLPEIVEQMKALCDMIHEVDPSIPIYSSTWHHQPQWDGYINVWGIGPSGDVPPQKMEELRRKRARLWFTTDGHMCIDTPYCAIERLLPHLCFHYGVEAYEFWGIDWLTYNPYEFGWHAYIPQSESPTHFYYIRYPNGDGYLAYPGKLIGYNGFVSSVRMEQAGEGVEDYEYLYLLRELVDKGLREGKDVSEGKKALELAGQLVTIPNSGGRLSTKLLPNPEKVYEVRDAIANAIEKIKKKL